jgi:hypothetical protein
VVLVLSHLGTEVPETALVATATVLGSLASGLLTHFTQRAAAVQNWEDRAKYDASVELRREAAELRRLSRERNATLCANGRTLLRDLRTLRCYLHSHKSFDDRSAFERSSADIRRNNEDLMQGWPQGLKEEARAIHATLEEAWGSNEKLVEFEAGVDALDQRLGDVFLPLAQDTD